MIKSTTNHNLIRQKRLEKGMSLTAFAKLVSMNKAQLSKIETGQQNLPVTRIHAFVNALDVPIDSLFLMRN